MPFDHELGVITCRCVVEQNAPILFVSHAGGDWQMYCHDSNHDFDSDETTQNDLCVVHVAHLVAKDPTLNEISDLPIDMGAERAQIGEQWSRFHNADEG